MHVPAVFNAQVLPTEHLSEIETSSREFISADLVIGIDADKGVIRTHNDEELKIEVDPSQTPPKWAEFKWVGGRDLHSTYSRFIVRVSASAKNDTTFNSALRINTPEGFVDVFSGAERPLGPEPTTSVFEFAPSPHQLEDCTSIDVQMFLPTSKNFICLHSMNVTALD